jgi:hypothetical protein
MSKFGRQFGKNLKETSRQIGHDILKFPTVARQFNLMQDENEKRAKLKSMSAFMMQEGENLEERINSLDDAGKKEFESEVNRITQLNLQRAIEGKPPIKIQDESEFLTKFMNTEKSKLFKESQENIAVGQLQHGDPSGVNKMASSTGLTDDAKWLMTFKQRDARNAQLHGEAQERLLESKSGKYDRSKAVVAMKDANQYYHLAREAWGRQNSQADAALVKAFEKMIQEGAVLQGESDAIRDAVSLAETFNLGGLSAAIDQGIFKKLDAPKRNEMVNLINKIYDKRKEAYLANLERHSKRAVHSKLFKKVEHAKDYFGTLPFADEGQNRIPVDLNQKPNIPLGGLEKEEDGLNSRIKALRAKYPKQFLLDKMKSKDENIQRRAKNLLLQVWNMEVSL